MQTGALATTGTGRVDAATGTLTVDTNLTNAGVLNVLAAGGLAVAGQLSSSGAMDVATGATLSAGTLRVTGGTATVRTGTFNVVNLTGGAVSTGTGNLAVTGSMTYGGGVTITAGSHAFLAGGADLANALGRLTLPAGTTTVGGTAAAGVGNLILADNATLTVGAQPMSVTGTVDWGNKSLTVSSGTVKFNLTAAASNALGSVLTINAGAPGATVELGGTFSALSDGVNHVDVVNDSTATLKVTGGGQQAGGITGLGNMVVTNGASVTVGRVQQNQLTIGQVADDVATVTVRSSGAEANVSVVGGLSIARNTANDAYTSTLDLKDNDLIIRATDGAVTMSTLAAITQAYHSGAWDGAGIRASEAANTGGLKALGIVQNRNPGPPPEPLMGTFDGQAVDLDDVLVKFTYSGDSNLDGKVDGFDLPLFLEGLYGTYTSTYPHLPGTPALWRVGDYNYDGKVDGFDLPLFLAGLYSGGAPLDGGVQEVGGFGLDAPVGGLGAPDASGGGVVPEPASLALLALGGLMVLRRSRPRKAA
jgi:hypothetical protein